MAAAQAEGRTLTPLQLNGEVQRIATQPDGRKGALLRAYDKATGKDAGSVYMPAPQSGSPMTYAVNGKQYVVVAISGQGYNGEYVAFKLPADQ